MLQLNDVPVLRKQLLEGFFQFRRVTVDAGEHWRRCERHGQQGAQARQRATFDHDQALQPGLQRRASVFVQGSLGLY
ncbi:hypothetical protein ALP29_200352 [Pseudomonas syringae pv. avii]|uniref:Uncharacterized protein n=1 Tax=Pseudomonas syringae pv. avii TaxID=663959 RepID=A0A3M5V5G8_PSESX|nr:hypothetical protein ALP29_200352 [Pseudomonas syringae pv. avii]